MSDAKAEAASAEASERPEEQGEQPVEREEEAPGPEEDGDVAVAAPAPEEEEESKQVANEPPASSSTEPYSVDNDPLLAISAAYEPHELLRALQPWEIARDHLVFGDMCGLDAGKRHLVHVLEPPSDAHGGVVLTAAGNTVQLLTLQPSADAAQVHARASNVLSRRYLFGTSGGGIGALAVHPSGRFFAVAEKGVKPAICVFQYPAQLVCCVLRNGTEQSYSSVCFSSDGETLASVGGSPDFLLTVWQWRKEQTVLRSKAFGQDVFSVRFAPNDSGFLTTSGVGHIRFWKMASTFTGLKLQGDIGKFGKSELSDIEAFCVLPDKKVLSGTERGVLLLWDGNFIKCEVFTSRRHLPHNGSVNVVQYEPDAQQVVTAGSDGVVRFWSFDAIDKADVPPDDTVALIPMKRSVMVQPQLDIRAVVRCGAQRYLIQSSDGAMHLLLLGGDTDAYDVVMDYVPNPTGGALGVACSPYEHLAATCGADGSVRLWDYVARDCLFAASTTVLTQGETEVTWTAEASCIAWVPNGAAMLSEPHLLKSRQLVVGFSDGLVRVFLADLARKTFVRTNVFKPHRKRVTAAAFSHSGVYLATASADTTVFLFKVVASPKSSKFAKFPPDYVPLGFQKTGDDVVSLVWREDDVALLVTLGNGSVVEHAVPMDGTLEALAEMRAARATTPAAPDAAETAVSKESETYELRFESRSFTTLQRPRPLSTRELTALEALNPTGNPQIDDAVKSQFASVEVTTALKAHAACYYDKDTLLLSIKMSSSSTAAASLVLCQWGRATPLREFASEATSPITTLRLSLSGKYVLCGLANGKFQIRTRPQPHAFLTGEFHDGTHTVVVDAATQAVLSYDDSFAVVCGADGNMSISRVHNERMELAARLLDEKYEKLVAEATISGEHAKEKQQALLDRAYKAAEDAKNNGEDPTAAAAAVTGTGTSELAMLPLFQKARAFAAYMETQLETTTVAQDDEAFRGVVRLVGDTNSTLGLPLAAAPTIEVAGAPVLSMLEVADIENPADAYTIEDAKRQSEADARALATRSKQDRTRDVLQAMRQQLQELRALDASYAAESRLEDEEWEIDLDYGELLAKRGDDACEEVKKELAYAVEQEELLLLKMREAYVSQLAVELFTLRAFESGLSVQSFRTMKMSPLLQKRLNEIHTQDAVANKKPLVRGGSAGSYAAGIVRRPSVLQIMAKDAELDNALPLKDEERRLMQRGGSVVGQSGPPGAPTVAAADVSTAGTTTGASVHGFEARKRLRADRKEKLQQWMNSKPGEDADDPRDLVAIAFAQRNMGDYKLKTAADYVVPEEQRVNAAKKRRQMALLEEQVYEAKLGFNAKVLELRELKLLLIQEMKSDMQRVTQLQRALAEYGHADGQVVDAGAMKKHDVDLTEWPEQRERVSDADIELFLRETKVRPHSVVTTLAPSDASGGAPVRRGSAASASTSGRRRSSVGFSAEVTIDGKKVELTDRSIAAVSRRLNGTEGAAAASDAASVLRVRHVSVDDLASTRATNRATSPSHSHRKSDADDELAVRVYLIKQEINRLQRKQREEVRAFDDAVAHLRREKMRLDVAFKTCELKLFTLLSELSLLEQFESRENLLSSKLEKSKGEKAAIMSEISDIQDSLATKKKEMEEWSRQEKAIQAEFLTLVNGSAGGGAGTGSQHPNFAALQKIFKKKIKRPKKKVGGGKDGKDGDGGGGDGDPALHDGDGNHDEDDDEDDEDEDDSDFDDDDDDDDDDEDDVCPPGCDLQLYEKVLALREKRADVDDAMSDLTKAMDELKKCNDRQVAKQRQIDKELQATELDIQLFQSEKQTRFNQLDVVVALSKQQIRCLVPKANAPTKWELPEQATACLVFNTRSFDALAQRIDGLQRENKSLRQQFKDLHKQQNVLAREKKTQQDTIAAIQKKCDQLQLLKFGQLVDLELLDKACDTTKVGELVAKVRVKEMDTERDVARVKQMQVQLKRQILEATEQNTALLARIAELHARQFELEKELNQANVSQSVLQDESEQLEREMQERSKLVKIVKLQAREVEALKQEIGLLRGKDGKVYAPRG